MVGIAPIENNIRENIFRWFGDIYHKSIDVTVRRSDMIVGNNNTRGRGRPKLTLDTVVNKNMIGLNFSEHLANDKS